MIFKQERHEGLQQHKSVMSTPANYYDRKSQIPEGTLFILPHPDRSEVSLGIWTWYHLISTEMKTEWEVFFPKEKGNINSRPKLFYSFVHPSHNAVRCYTDFKTHTFPSFYHLWTGNASCNQWCLTIAVTWLSSPVHTHLVIAVHVVSKVHGHCWSYMWWVSLTF